MAVNDAELAFRREVENFARLLWKSDLIHLWFSAEPHPLAVDANEPDFPAEPMDRRRILERIRARFGVTGVNFAADLPLLRLH
jgi:hypothetical protein